MELLFVQAIARAAQGVALLDNAKKQNLYWLVPNHRVAELP